MSQFYVGVTAGSLPPSAVETFTADDATVATAAANNINNLSATTTANNINGIRTTNSGSTINVQLTNTITGTLSTTDATTTTMITFPFSTNTGPGTYLFDFHSAAYNLTDALSAGYETQFCVRWDGVNGNLVNPQDFVTIEEGAMSACDLAFTVSGANLLVRVTGLAGKNINWLSSGKYIYVS